LGCHGGPAIGRNKTGEPERRERWTAMRRTHMTRHGMFGAFLLGLAATSSTGQSVSSDRAGSLPPEEVLPVYSPDPADSWNRVFQALFARTVRVRLSKEFAGAAPLERVSPSRRQHNHL
jgi:hypothetical protein